MKNLRLLAAVLAVALVAMPASASVQNVKISGSIDSTFLHRENFDFNTDSTAALAATGSRSQNVFLTQTTLRVDADLTDQVSTTIGLINERAWTAPTTANTDIDLYLAYVTLREMLYSPLTLIVGRQVFNFGNSFVFDATGTNASAPADSGLSGVAGDLTKQTSLDAVRAILDYNPLTLTAFAAITNANTVVAASTDDDVNVYGLNATYELGDELNSVVEAYIFSKKDKSTNSSVGDKADIITVKGVRASSNILDGLNVQGEFAYQGGTKSVGSADNLTRKAFGLQGIVAYQIPEDILPDVLKGYNATTKYTFTKVTGEERGSSPDQKWTEWDPFFEAQDGGTIYNTLFGLSNMIKHGASLTVNPMEDVTSTIQYTKLWRQQAYDVVGTSLSLVQPDGTSVSVDTNRGKKGLGQELDFMTTYDYTEDVQIGMNLGLFWPGEVFHDSTPAKQLLVNLNVAF